MTRTHRIIGLLALTMVGAAGAQQARDDGGAARLQAQVQQLTTERTQLQTQNKELTTNLDAANAELKKLREGKTDLERRLGQTETSLSQATATSTRNSQSAEQLRTRMDELIKQFRETAETLKQTELDRNQLRASLASRDGELKQCVTNNRKLFDTGNEVLDRYEDKGCFTSLREREPFTQNKRVALQNLVDGYRWSLEDQLLPAAKGAPPADAGDAKPPSNDGT